MMVVFSLVLLILKQLAVMGFVFHRRKKALQNEEEWPEARASQM